MKKTKAVFIILLISTLPVLSQRRAQTQEERDYVQKLVTAYQAITSLYVDKTNDTKIVEDALTGILEKLDPHSSYTNAEETRKMNEPLEGNFDGIGIQFNMLTDTLYVIQVISGGPSEKVGILPGDRMIYVDDSLIAGVKMPSTDVMKKLRGKKGTEVTVQIKRSNNPELLKFKIIRDKIPVYSLDASYMADKQTGYIRLSRFAASTPDEFRKALEELKKQGMKNLILDLQDNGGGYLNIAYDLADEFLDKEKLVVYTKGNAQPRQDAVSTSKGMFETGKLVIMVNETSASASEILAGAVQDWDRGVIVGRRTFGKGLVQRPIMLPDTSMIRLTVARYYTPSGRNIQKPYESGNIEAYNHDLIDRFNHGELMSADSIHFPDSLKYTTLVSHRTVYGGGGIMPDIFIPIDTTRSTDYHSKLGRYGIIYKTAMNYIDSHRKEMNTKYSDFKKFNEKFEITEGMLGTMKQMAADEKIEYNEEQFNQSKALISLQIKAYMARDLFDTSEFFQTVNGESDTYRKALEIINDDGLYRKILSEE
ncbi:MAG: S41 family peptidase [Tannerella sp.]|jgi:carboxyl-terminal processing protease|nr:S41 family peptidase [Tannerella sp.]